MDAKRQDKILELFKKIDASPGRKISNLLADFEISRYIVTKNFEELLKQIELHEMNPSVVLNKDRERRRQFSKELLRRLHNYLASVYTLRQQTYVFKGKFNNAELDGEFQKKISALNKNPRKHILDGLRTYAQHYDNPPCIIALRYTIHLDAGEVKSSETQSLELDGNALLVGIKWKPEAKSFIQKNEQIILKDILLEYQKNLDELYDWLHGTVTALYQHELQEYSKTKEELHRIAREGKMEGKGA